MSGAGFSTESGCLASFRRIGLDDKKALETLKNPKLTSRLCQAIEAAGENLPGRAGQLLYVLASTANQNSETGIPLIANIISEGLISRDSQVHAALLYVSGRTLTRQPIDNDALKAAAGAGITISVEDIDTAVAEIVELNRELIQTKGSGVCTGILLKKIRSVAGLEFADGRMLKERLEAAISVLPTTWLNKNEECDEHEKTLDTLGMSSLYSVGQVLKLHKPGENPQICEELRTEHLKATGGRVVTRFPPEPNGYLHIGHAKAINFSFGYAAAHGGITYLRYDDTNPEAEKQEYYDAIKEAVTWLGFTPHAITSASDYFPQLYEYATRLVEKGLAYVCHMTPEEIHQSRGGDAKGPRTASPWRDRPVEENMRLFVEMHDGKHVPGSATLRLKQDMESTNPFMWDLVAYRILDTPHCRTGHAWNIYPMYDFTHCLCDSLENITHSLCTTEFILAREAYYWVCDNVGVYKPVQWEYGRLNITGTVLSKRKLTRLVSEGVVNGWDDPRLYTLAGIRRRGVTSSAVNKFVSVLGITTAFSTVDVRLFENLIREDLNETSRRVMAVLEPISVLIDEKSWKEVAEPTLLTSGARKGENGVWWISIPDIPGGSGEMREVPISRRLFIDSSDFSENAEEGYRRLTSTQSVGLFKASFAIAFEGHSDDGGVLVKAVVPSTRTFIQWIGADPQPVRCEVRLYSNLFKSRCPDDAPGGWMCDTDAESLQVVDRALVDVRVGGCRVEEKFQFQRLGYFCVDRDSRPDLLVFNRTVTLREDAGKQMHI